MKCLKCGKQLRTSRCECGFDCLKDMFLAISPYDDYLKNFRHGKMREVGTVTLDNGRVYTGELVNGIPNGKGKSKDPDGEVYEGEFKDGKYNGTGFNTFEDGSTYEGQHKDDKRHGKGIYHYADGSVREGEWRNGVREGKAICRYANGNVYDGDWLNGGWHGRGVLVYANGDRYEGEFKDDKKSGYGVETHIKGASYEGEWLDGKRHGQGVCRFDNGDIYNGSWVDDSPCGKGVAKFSDGSSYDGDWLNGKKHGQGVITYADGQVVRGEWKNNELVNQGAVSADNYRVRANANSIFEKIKKNKKADLETAKEQIAIWKNTISEFVHEPEITKKRVQWISEEEDHVARLERDIRILDTFKFMMPVEEVFEVTGRGVIAVGRVEVGSIQIGDSIEIILKDGKKISSTVTQIEMYHKTLDHAQVGDNVGIGLKGVKKNDVVNAQAIVNHGADASHKTFTARIHLHEKDTKPIFNHYYPGFSFSSPEARIESRGMLTFSDEKKTMMTPGEDTVVNITLDNPCVMHCGMKFGIHEGGNRWTAKGEIISVIS